MACIYRSTLTHSMRHMLPAPAVRRRAASPHARRSSWSEASLATAWPGWTWLRRRRASMPPQRAPLSQAGSRSRRWRSTPELGLRRGVLYRCCRSMRHTDVAVRPRPARLCGDRVASRVDVVPHVHDTLPAAVGLTAICLVCKPWVGDARCIREDVVADEIPQVSLGVRFDHPELEAYVARVADLLEKTRDLGAPLNDVSS